MGMDAMRVGKDAMASMNRTMGVEQVEDTMDEVQEQMDLANEVNEAVGRQINIGYEDDEDELERQLEELQQESLDEAFLAVDKTPTTKVVEKKLDMPEVPKTEAEMDEERELRELEASLQLA